MKGTKADTLRSSLAMLLVALMVITSISVITPATAKASVKPSLTKTTRTILVGKTYDLNVENKVKYSTYTWSSSDTAIATVDKKGVVKGKNKGLATVTCKVKTPVKTYKLTCKVTVLKGASGFFIKNKVTALNVGQTYDLNRMLTPPTSNDKTTWTSSDNSIAKPDKNGKFMAMKEGTVTITGTTLSGKKDSVTIKVVDMDGTVTNQSELTSLLGSGATKITVKTADAVSFEIPMGNYSNQTLVFDAPNADMNNYGTFASINIKQIKSDTWFEHSNNNIINVAAPAARVVVGANASASINLDLEGAALKLVNNGTVTGLTVAKKATVDISGDMEGSVPVSVSVPDVTITSSVPLNLTCTAKVALVLSEDAAATTVQAATEDAIPTISGSVTIKVTIGSGSSAVVKEVSGTTGGGAAGGAAGGSNGTLGSTTVTNNGTSTTYALSQSCTLLKTVLVIYGGETYTVSGTTLATLKLFLDNDAAALALWQGTTDVTNTYDGQTVTVAGTAGSTQKTVSFSGTGSLSGKSYTVNVTGNNSVTVTSGQTGKSFTVTKSADNMSLTISGTQGDLLFIPYY